MPLRRSLEALGFWLGLAPRIFVVHWGMNLNPPPRPVEFHTLPRRQHLPLASLPHRHVCRWLSKCQLWSKYHRAASSGGPLPGSGSGHTLPTSPQPDGLPQEQKQTKQEPPGWVPLPLSACTDAFDLKTMSAPHFHLRGGGRAAEEGL